MRKMIMMLALAVPLMAQQVEVKEVDGKTEVIVKKDCPYCDKKGGMKRGDMQRRMGMQQTNQDRKKMHKKQQIKNVVKLAVVGGLAYYIGYHEGEKHFKGGMGMKRRPFLGDKK